MLVAHSVFVTAGVLAGAVTVCLSLLGYLHQRRTMRARIEEERLQGARTNYQLASERLDQALRAFRGLPWRLENLADSLAAAALAGRELDRVGFPRGTRGDDMASWQTPEELHRDSPRPGDPRRWQALDRAISTALATADDPTAGYGAGAAACEQLAAAARALSAEVDATPRPHAREQCWFCGQTADQVRTLIAGEHASICDECVEFCNEVLS
jgi:ClpX C4-type zinc finger